MLAVVNPDRNEVVLPSRVAAPPAKSAKSVVPFWVDVPESLLGPLPSNIRTRIWLTLANVARACSPAERAHLALGDGYRLVYQVDALKRAVTLLEVEYRAETEASA